MVPSFPASHPSSQHAASLGHCPHLPHSLGMDEMIVTPDGRVIVVLPLQVDIQVGQVVALRDCELLPDLIALLLSALGRKKGSPGPMRRAISHYHLPSPQLKTHQRSALTI